MSGISIPLKQITWQEEPVFLAHRINLKYLLGFVFGIQYIFQRTFIWCAIILSFCFLLFLFLQLLFLLSVLFFKFFPNFSFFISEFKAFRESLSFFNSFFDVCRSKYRMKVVLKLYENHFILLVLATAHSTNAKNRKSCCVYKQV